LEDYEVLDLLSQAPGLGIDLTTVKVHVRADDGGTLHAHAAAPGCLVHRTSHVVSLADLLDSGPCLNCFSSVTTKGGWSGVTYLASALELILDTELLTHQGGLSAAERFVLSTGKDQLLERFSDHAASGLPPAFTKALRRARRSAEAAVVELSDADVAHLALEALLISRDHGLSLHQARRRRHAWGLCRVEHEAFYTTSGLRRFALERYALTPLEVNTSTSTVLAPWPALVLLSEVASLDHCGAALVQAVTPELRETLTTLARDSSGLPHWLPQEVLETAQALL
jgi:hypothetical protein